MKNEIAYLYNPEFIEIDGNIILASEKDNYEVNKNNFELSTELELFINHIHILDCFENDAEIDEEPFYNENAKDFIYAWKVAQELVELWATKLREKFPTYHFEIQGTKYDNPIIRFCKTQGHEKTKVIKNSDSYTIIT